MDDFWKTLLTALSSAGVAGAVLAWYLVKFEPGNQALIREMRDGFTKIAEAMYKSAKADMLRLIASPHVADAVKAAAAELVNDITKEVAKEIPK